MPPSAMFRKADKPAGGDAMPPSAMGISQRGRPGRRRCDIAIGDGYFATRPTAMRWPPSTMGIS